MNSPRTGESELPHNTLLDEFAEYPFVRLDATRAALRARGVTPIDLTLGDPREVTPPFLRQALRDAVPERSAYPTVLGRHTLRRAIAGWMERRFGVALDPEREILPASGSKEAIFHFAWVVVDAASPRRRVVIPTPAYPVYARAARMAGGQPTPLPLDGQSAYRPRLAEVPEPLWRETALLWLNYPHNPTGATASLDLYTEALELAARFGFVVASDEAYSEIYEGTPPPSLLQAGRRRAVVFHSLSKRSAMTGFRSGFVAGDPRLIAAYGALRPTVGVASPDFVQAAAEAAWGDEEHVERIRSSFAGRLGEGRAALSAAGLEVFAGGGTFFLWVRAPGGDDEALAESWAERGVLVLPGSWLDPAGRGFVRLALVPSLVECQEAFRRLAS